MRGLRPGKPGRRLAKPGRRLTKPGRRLAKPGRRLTKRSASGLRVSLNCPGTRGENRADRSNE